MYSAPGRRRIYCTKTVETYTRNNNVREIAPSRSARRAQLSVNRRLYYIVLNDCPSSSSPPPSSSSFLPIYHTQRSLLYYYIPSPVLISRGSWLCFDSSCVHYIQRETRDRVCTSHHSVLYTRAHIIILRIYIYIYHTTTVGQHPPK